MDPIDLIPVFLKMILEIRKIAKNSGLTQEQIDDLWKSAGDEQARIDDQQERDETEEDRIKREGS